MSTATLPYVPSSSPKVLLLVLKTTFFFLESVHAKKYFPLLVCTQPCIYGLLNVIGIFILKNSFASILPFSCTFVFVPLDTQTFYGCL